MLKNYLKVALRNLLRQKGHAFINVAGLTLGLACCLVLFQYVAFEYSFDRFHAHEADLYRVTTNLTPPDDPEFEENGGGSWTPHAMGPALAEGVPEILHAARLHPAFTPAIVSSPSSPERVYEEERVYYADPDFLEMFTFPLVAGDAAALAEPGAAFLSETAARKYFGTERPLADAVGETLDVAGEVDRGYRVAGVFADVPAASSLQFDLLLSMEDLLQSEEYTKPASFWSWNSFLTYVQLRPDADPAEAARKMTVVYDTNFPELFRAGGFVARARVQPLRDVHLNADLSGPDMVVTGSYQTVSFFTIIGLVTLLIALVNYVNLATARSLERAREVGVRKAVGAQRGQLVAQFLAESALTVLAAAALALVVAAALTPLMNDVAGTHLSWASWLNPAFLTALAGILLVSALLAGLYPAFVLSAFRPATVLKGQARTFGSQLWLRRGLVVFQFAASVVLIGGTAVVYSQLGYMRNLDLGLDLDQVLTVDAPRVLPEEADPEAAVNTFAEELRRLPSVRAVATSSTLPGGGFNSNGVSIRKVEDDQTSAIRSVVSWVDTSFAALYGLELVASEGPELFTPPSDDAPVALIPNETAVRALGFETPQDALGYELDVAGWYTARIVGVFKDYNWSSAHTERQNIFLGRSPGGQHVSLKVSTADLPGTLAAVGATYARLFPGNVFRYAFADESFDRQYRDDEQFAKLFALFAGLAIAIACLGLFGLAAFTAEQRRKEIGIRKVLGASVHGLVGMLSLDFLKLVVVAVGIASPVAYLLMQRWLEGFAYRIGIGPGVFLLAGAIALVIALATVGSQALRAASTDPVKALRYE